MLTLIKQSVSKMLSPKAHWTVAGLINPYSAAITGAKNKETFYKLGNYELELFKKLKVINKYDKTLEIGCGPGRIQWALAQSELELEIHGTDFSPSMIRLARKHVPLGHFSVGNGRNLEQYRNNFFDLVYSFVVFQHVDEKNFHNYCLEAYRVLKSKGNFVFQIQSSEGKMGYKRPIGHPWLIRSYTRKEIFKILESSKFSSINVFDMNGKKNPKTVDDSGFLFVAGK